MAELFDEPDELDDCELLELVLLDEPDDDVADSVSVDGELDELAELELELDDASEPDASSSAWATDCPAITQMLRPSAAAKIRRRCW